MSSFRIFKCLGIVLSECIFVSRVASLCLARDREREAQRHKRLRTRAHEKVLAERGLRHLELASAL